MNTQDTDDVQEQLVSCKFTSCNNMVSVSKKYCPEHMYLDNDVHSEVDNDIKALAEMLYDVAPSILDFEHYLRLAEFISTHTQQAVREARLEEIFLLDDRAHMKEDCMIDGHEYYFTRKAELSGDKTDEHKGVE